MRHPKPIGACTSWLKNWSTSKIGPGNGGFAIAHVELHGLSRAQFGAHGHGARLAVHAHDVANEKIALTDLFLHLAHDHAQEDRVAGQFLIAGLHAVVDVLEHLNGGLLVE